MGVPVSITFHRVSPSAWIENDIRTRAEKLEEYCHLLRSCRVVVDVPHRHHQQGNRFRMHVELTVPDEPIAVTRDAPLNAPPRNLALVIREVFGVARRRLQDYARRHRFAVKRHSLPSPRMRSRAPRRTRPRDRKAA